MFTLRKLSRVGAAAAIALSSLGCVARVRTYSYVEPVEPAVVVLHEAPILVAIEPGVWVVQDSDVVVYYVSGWYWHCRAGVWYRSSYWDGDWAVVGVHVVPPLIIHRHHHHYVRYRAPAHVHAWRPPPEHSRHHRRSGDHYEKPYRPAGYDPPSPPPRRPRHTAPPKRPRKPYHVPERVEPPRRKPLPPPQHRRPPKKVPKPLPQPQPRPPRRPRPQARL